MLRAELALTGAQILFWVALIGVLLGLGARVLKGRRSVGAHAVGNTASPTSFPASANGEASHTHAEAGNSAPGE
jgi:hypothetical protein